MRGVWTDNVLLSRDESDDGKKRKLRDPMEQLTTKIYLNLLNGRSG
jgi:hypothetical protein